MVAAGLDQSVYGVDDLWITYIHLGDRNALRPSRRSRKSDAWASIAHFCNCGTIDCDHQHMATQKLGTMGGCDRARWVYPVDCLWPRESNLLQYK